MCLAVGHSPSHGFAGCSHCRNHNARIVLIQCGCRLLGCQIRLTAEHDTVHMCRRCCLQLCRSCAVLWMLQLRRRSLVRESLCIEEGPCGYSRLGILDTMGTAGEGRQLPGRCWHAIWHSRTLQERFFMLHAGRASLSYKTPM